MAKYNEKYPWGKLRSVGDVFLCSTEATKLQKAAWGWTRGRTVRIKVHKIRGGSLAVRVA